MIALSNENVVSLFRLPKIGRLAKRFARADDGTTAIEFSLVSLPFVVMTFGLIELVLVLLVCTTLETATEAASRRIRTGEFQESGSNTKTDFKNLVCARMSWLADQCASNLFVDVRTFNNFAALAANAPAPPDGFNPNSTCFTPGAPTDIVLVRAYFKWRLITPVIDAVMENMGGGTGMRLISTTTAFRNEPYNESQPVGARC
jgi:Flp pilus assembly protein TadG